MPIINITSTEAGAAGRYINLGSPASQDGLVAQTIIAYCKPAAGTVTGYMLAKCSSTATLGPRFVVASDGAVGFGADSTGVALAPERLTASTTATLGTWNHYQVTWDGGVAGTNIALYLGAGANIAVGQVAGSGTVNSDAAQDLYLMNRPGLEREFMGDVAYVARWSRVLTDAERTTVRTTGPLDVPAGLTLCWANGQDYSTNALIPVARSARVTGSMPTNTALGESGVVTPSLGLSDSLGGHFLNQTALNQAAGTFAGMATSQAQQSSLNTTRNLSASVASGQAQSTSLDAQRTGLASLGSSQSQAATALTARTLAAAIVSAQGQTAYSGQSVTLESSQGQSSTLQATRSLSAAVQSNQAQEASGQAFRSVAGSGAAAQSQSAGFTTAQTLSASLSSAQSQTTAGGQGATSVGGQGQSAGLEAVRAMVATVQGSQSQNTSGQAQRAILVTGASSQAQSAQALFWRQLQTFMATTQAQSSAGYAGRSTGASFYMSGVLAGSYRSSVATTLATSYVPLNATQSYVPLDATESLVEN